MKISAKRVRELLRYDAETGYFFHRITTSSRAIAGRRAGTTTPTASHGYNAIGLEGEIYLVHRIVWLYVHGKWPDHHIDHVNGDKTDNRIANLREATRSQNLRNSRRPKTNSSGFKGASLHRKTGRYAAHIRINGKSTYLGLFDTAQEAHAAYRAAAELHFKEFARAS